MLYSLQSNYYFQGSFHCLPCLSLCLFSLSLFHSFYFFLPFLFRFLPPLLFFLVETQKNFLDLWLCGSLHFPPLTKNGENSKRENMSTFCFIGWKLKTLMSRRVTLHVFFIKKSLICLSLNFLNFSRNRAWDFLEFFITFTEINWLEWFTLSLLILYTWIWFASLTFWMQ